MGISVGIVVARSEGQSDHLMFEPQEPNIINGLSEFLDFPPEQPVWLIPDSQALAVLLNLSDNMPTEIEVPLLLTNTLRASFLLHSAREVLEQKTT